jgi:beta-N-acetylhexosaminidase
MIMPAYSSTAAAEGEIAASRVGGFVFLGNNNLADSILNATNHLQSVTSVPLIFSIDCEAGSGARLTDGTKFPMNMATAATANATLAGQEGRVTARECRAIGVQIGFGPCLDVNTEPVNPIIGIRSYGDNPALVAQMAQAHVQGANAEGLLCTFKHFPGHGATTGDSHSSLPTVTISVDELQTRHVAPYASLIGGGMGDLVMSAHVWYPSLDPGATAWPATLSVPALTGILRNQLGFTGVAISDSYGMSGLRLAAADSDSPRLGVQAGLDIILMPPDAAVARDSLLSAVGGGQLTLGRIDDSVRRILMLKSRVGMPESTTVSLAAKNAVMQHPDHLAAARDIAARSICSARVQPSDLPLTPAQSVYCIVLNTSEQIFYRYPSGYFTDALKARIPSLDVTTASATITTTQRATMVNTAKTYQRVVVANYNWKPTLTGNQAALVQDLLGAGVTVVYSNFGSPYQITQWPALENYFCAFCTHYESQIEMARVLTGESPAPGTWPVAIPGVSSVAGWKRY